VRSARSAPESVSSVEASTCSSKSSHASEVGGAHNTSGGRMVAIAAARMYTP
jgi:hypothetical protein